MPIDDEYQVERNFFSQSAASHIYRCTSRRNNAVYAVKVYAKDRLTHRKEHHVYEEAMVGQSVPKHPNLTRIVQVFDDAEHINLVMEYMEGGSLFDVISRCGRFTEARARPIFRQLLTGLQVLHEARIMHRDIKPENLFFRTPFHDDGAQNVLTIGDYGFATRTIPSEEYVGSPQYSAPELALIALQYHTKSIHKPLYNEACDMWSAGVVLFVMLTGLLPFDGPNPTEVFTAVVRNQLPLKHNNCANLSHDAKSLILALTESNPSKRLTAKVALRNQWFR